MAGLVSWSSSWDSCRESMKRHRKSMHYWKSIWNQWDYIENHRNCIENPCTNWKCLRKSGSHIHNSTSMRSHKINKESCLQYYSMWLPNTGNKKLKISPLLVAPISEVSSSRRASRRWGLKTQMRKSSFSLFFTWFLKISPLRAYPCADSSFYKGAKHEVSGSSHIYIFFLYIYIYIYTYRERERERDREIL